jgi:cysteine-S-conjugate beta-lyase
MRDETRMVHSGRCPEKHDGTVNLPVYHASTIIFPSLEDFKKRAEADKKYRGVRYGAYGTPTTFSIADAVSELEGSPCRGVVTSSGQAAVSFALMTFVRQGDHILVSDSVYGPTRSFCDTVLSGFGVETTYYAPLIGSGILSLIRPNTRLVLTESPGSLTFEVQDVPAIAAAAHKRDVLVLLDNTWATPLYFKPFSRGVDVSIQAGTKYISGGSDLVLGIITAGNEELFRRIRDFTTTVGETAGPDDCYLALRGLRSMSARLTHQQTAALKVAEWLRSRPEVKRVLYPALPDDPGHGLWKRDFTGASSLFGVVLHTADEHSVAAMIDGYRFFKIGASWGGFESLVIPATPGLKRTAVPWTEEGYLLRYHVGLENPEELIYDLQQGFVRLNASISAARGKPANPDVDSRASRTTGSIR